jgi:hypothetical protein
MKKIVLILIIALSSAAVKSQSLDVSKNYVLYIFHIAKYIEWPENHNPFIIGVLGNSPVTNLMTSNYKGKIIKESSISVRKYNDLNEVTDCQILFIPRSQKQFVQEAAKKFSNSNVLIISEFDNATHFGAAINFVIDQDESVKFELNKNTIKKAKLKLNNNLLALAVLVN